MAQDSRKYNDTKTFRVASSEGWTSERLLYQFPANVDIHNTTTAWEKFYAYVWNKYFLYAQNIQPSALQLRLKDELERYNGSLHYHGNSPWYYVLFENEKDYTWFIMKWS